MKSLKPVTRLVKRGPIPVGSISPDFIAAYNRLPSDSKLRLAWVVNLTENVGKIPKEPQERRRITSEIYALVGYAGLVPAGGNVPGPSIESRSPESAAQNILRSWQDMIQAALRRDPIRLVTRQGSLVRFVTADRSLIWFEPQNRYLEATMPLEYYEELAAQALANLLLKHGHLIKGCPAPRLRGKPGERCENVFVASRPNKLYCSSACQSRATTAEKRKRDEKAPKRMKK